MKKFLRNYSNFNIRSKKAYVFFGCCILVGIILGILIYISQLYPKKSSLDDNKVSETYILSKMRECHESPKRSLCLKEVAKDFITRFSLKEILRIFQEHEKEPELIAICHEATHYLGREEYFRRRSLKDVFPSCNHSCLGGCFHGAVEGYFIEKNLLQYDAEDPRIVSEIPKICGKESDHPRPQEFTECFHGLGHAVMFMTENDLLRSLKLCDQLQTQDERELCYTGAFMANSDGAKSEDHPSKYFKTDDPMYPCTILEKKYLNICYTYAILQPFQSDLEKTIKLCLQAPNEYKKSCFRTMGGDRVYNTPDEQIMKNECDLISEAEFREGCYEGTVGSLVVRYGLDSDKPFIYCSFLESQYKDSCYRELARRLKNWTLNKDKLLSICLKMPKEYNSSCRAAVK